MIDVLKFQDKDDKWRVVPVDNLKYVEELRNDICIVHLKTGESFYSRDDIHTVVKPLITVKI